MKKFDIYDSNNNECVKQGIDAGNGKSALKRFMQCLTSTGMYEIHKFKGVWTLSSSYGAYFVAKEV